MRNDFQEGVFLAHSAKGTSWKSTKYLKKVPLGNNRYYYIYTKAQLDAWNRRHSSGSSGAGSGQPTNVLSNKERDSRKQAAISNNPSLDSIIRNGMVAKGNTLAEKTANLKKNIADGEKAINEALSKSGSKKGSGSGSSGSSKKSKSGGSGKSSKSSSKKEAKEKTAKEKNSSTKVAKEKTTKEKATKQKIEQDNTPINMDSLKKIYGKEDKDISSFSGTAAEFKKNLLEKYKDGAFGYLSAGDTVYKFTIQNGNVILQDFKEFKSNTKKK